MARRALIQARLAQTIAAADLNGDGLTDVAVADFLNDSLTIRLATPAGGFAAARTLPAGRGPRSVAAADFDNDGSIDLAVAAFLDGTLHVFRGRGTGSFDESHVQRLGVGLSSIAAGDFDGDGLVDLATANAFTGRIGLLKHPTDAAAVHTVLARAESTTLLLRVGTGDRPELLAVSADGENAHLITLEGQARQASSLDSDLDALLTLAANGRHGAAAAGDARRLAKRAGDGQVMPAGSSGAEPLIVDIEDAGGEPGAGAEVVFTRTRGSAAIEEAGAVDHTGTSDVQGRVSVKVLAPDLPDASVIAAIEGGRVAHFGVLSTLENDDIGNLIAAALGRERSDAASRAQLHLRVQHALERLREEDALEAIRQLGAIVDESQQSGIGSADQLARRFIDQILVAGVSPAAIDTDPLACNVTLTRTIATNAEVDALTLSAVAGERIYVAFANEGGVAGFNPAWRVLAPGGAPIAGCGTFTTLSADCSLPSAGTYTVEVADSDANATGTYSIQVQRLRSTERCGGTIACDVAQSNTLAASGRADTDMYSFSGVALETVHISLKKLGGAAAFNPAWRLLLPDGAPASTCGIFSTVDRDCQLGVAGSHAIQVADSSFDGTGSYGVHLQRLTAAQRCGGTVSCNVTSSHTVGTVNLADTNLHSFNAVAGERIYVVLTSEGGTLFNPVWRLVAPDGSFVPGCNTFTTTIARDCSLPAAGSYAIEVADGSLDGSGSYGLHIQRLTAGQRCDGTTIGCDAPQTTALGSAGHADTNLHSFSSTAGEVVRINVALQSGAAGFFPAFRLLLPDGSPDPGCGTFSGSRDCTLSLSGSYAIHVADDSHDSTGTYSVHVQRLTAVQRCGGTIACDASSTTPVGSVARADSNLHSFPAVANERVYITFKGDNVGTFNPVWRLVSPAGTPVAGCGTFTNLSQDCTLTGAGSYAIEVQDSSLDASGNYHLNLQRLTAGQRCGTSLTCGAALNSTVGTPNRADSNVHSFTGIASQSVNVTVGNASGAGFNPIYRLLLPDGSPAASCGTFAAAGTRACTLSVAGSYAVHVVDNALDGGGTYDTTVAGAGCTGGSADMVISLLKAPKKAAAGGNITVKPTTKNNGPGPSGPTTTRIFLSNNNTWDPGDTQLGADNPVPGLAAGATKPDSVSVTIPPGTSPGKKFIIAFADAGNAQAETSETNNTLAKSITIGPDLIISAFVAPATAGPGNTISVTVTTQNNGGAAVTVATTTRLYFSNDAKVDAGDPFQALSVGPLGVGASQSHTVSVTIPAGTPLGGRYLIAVADHAGQVAEASEKNTKKKGITIQ